MARRGGGKGGLRPDEGRQQGCTARREGEEAAAHGEENTARKSVQLHGPESKV